MALTAIPVGFVAGLFGIGGGLISVPFLFFIFETFGIDRNYLMHLTVGTAFTITILTSFSSVLAHRKHGAVDLSIIKTFGIFVILFSSEILNKNLHNALKEFPCAETRMFLLSERFFFISFS